MSYQILVDMLYEKGRYQDVRDVFDIIKSRQIQGGMYPKHVLVIVFAACYKEVSGQASCMLKLNLFINYVILFQNTPESFKYSTNLWKDLNNVGHIPMRKTTTFAAALALAQNAPHVALEIVSTVKQQNYMTVRNLKVIALALMGRGDDVLPILRSVLETTDPSMPKHTFSKDVIELVSEAIHKSEDKETIGNFTKIEKYLTDNGHISDTVSRMN